ncbi:Mbeg1-like protein [Collinsella tanakaei]|uniref:Mbeg1-like protein n=1 Tax=Collinsella tanakaei TaxID=626935 RepID=UPI00248DE064|nr:Mbeg1-like protein [Collinsella tanakaei]
MDEKPSLPRRSKSAATFLTYVRERMDTFLDRPLCAIDSLVFSWLAYAHLGEDQVNACLPEGIALHEMLRAEEFDNMFGSTWDPEGSRDLLFAVCASPRFRDARLTVFRFKTARSAEEQFAAMTFILPDGSSYVAFRGTDSTIVGWKEDFNMTFLNPVPAQEEARAYLEYVASVTAGPLYVGGHSKGGNLAVYAVATCNKSCRERVVRVFSHDGPGFHREFCASDAYRNILPIMVKTVPKSSMIGAVLSEGPDCHPIIVESGGFSLFQHNPFLWEVDVESATFVEADGFTASSRYFDSTLDAWMDKCSLAERARFVDALFDVIRVTGAKRFSDIMADRKTNVLLMLEAVEGLDPDLQQFIRDVLRSFARTATVEKAAGAASGIAGTIKKARPSVALAVTTFKNRGEGSD